MWPDVPKLITWFWPYPVGCCTCCTDGLGLYCIWFVVVPWACSDEPWTAWTSLLPAGAASSWPNVECCNKLAQPDQLETHETPLSWCYGMCSRKLYYGSIWHHEHICLQPPWRNAYLQLHLHLSAHATELLVVDISKQFYCHVSWCRTTNTCSKILL